MDDLPEVVELGEHPEATWRLSSGERVWAAPGVVCVGRSERSIDDVEGDARALLAAVAWARGGRC